MQEKFRTVIGQVPSAEEAIASDVIKTKLAVFDDVGSNAILATRGSDITVTKSHHSEKSRRLVIILFPQWKLSDFNLL